MRNQQRIVGAWMLGFALTLGVTGTTSAQVRSEIELTRQQIQTERQQLVAATDTSTSSGAARWNNFCIIMVIRANTSPTAGAAAAIPLPILSLRNHFSYVTGSRLTANPTHAGWLHKK